MCCDYSLEVQKSRLAKVADELIVSTFRDTFSKGLYATDDKDCAVCLKPGTEVEFAEMVTYQVPYAYGTPVLLHAHRTARFRQVDKEQTYTHHDAFEFPDGTVIKLQHLMLGQHVRVLQMPLEEPLAEKAPTVIDRVLETT